MTTLTNFPMVNQNTPITSDGVPSPNGPFDCVAASICAVMLYLLGLTEVSKDGWNPDKVLDLAYPEGYQGPTDAHAYVAPLAKLGFHLSAVSGNPAQLVSLAHQYLQQGKPVIFTEADPYVPASYGWTHVCVFYSESAGVLTCLDPYIGKPVTYSDSEWTNLLKDNQLWLIERIPEDVPVTIDIHTPYVGEYYDELSATCWQRKNTPTSKPPLRIANGMLLYYKTNGTVPYCGLSSAGLVLSNEIPVESIGPDFAHLAGQGIVIVFLERQVWAYDPRHLLDNPPGAGDVYPVHLYGGSPGVDPAIAGLLKQIADLHTQLLAAQHQAQPSPVPDPRIAQYQDTLKHAQSAAQTVVSAAQQVVTIVTV